MNKSDVRLLICPYNYLGTPGVSHTGLSVSAMNTAKVLGSNGFSVVMRPVRNALEIATHIDNEKATHVVINAFWAPTATLADLVQRYPFVTFAVVCHSNIAFLQVEPNGITKMREAMDLETASLGNFHLAGNALNFVTAVEDGFEAPCVYLPNLYYLKDQTHFDRPKWSGGTLRIGAFGAGRPLKNPTVSAVAALSIASSLGTDLEFHINSGRSDGWGDRLIKAVRAIFAGMPHARLIEDPWDTWPNFRRTVRNMHLLLQPSFTESFNVVTADGVAEGVPSVTSDVIEWVPDWWKAPPDNANEVARVGRSLLSDPHTGRDGVRALEHHNRDGVFAWTQYLTA